jgi:hypothetical protein
VRIRRDLVDGQPVPSRGQFGHRSADVGVRIVPDEDERAAELLVGGIQQPGVTGLGEALAPVLTPTVAMDPVDRPGAAAGLDRDQRGQRQACVVSADDFHHLWGF